LESHIYKDNNFTITKELFISGNVRFAIQHLCSLKLEKARKKIPYVLATIEIILILAGLIVDFPYHSLVTLLGVIGIIASTLVYIFIKPVHKLYLVFASGEREMIGVTDYSYIEGLANAFSRSIVESRK
jgi:hypothetical protein